MLISSETIRDWGDAYRLRDKRVLSGSELSEDVMKRLTELGTERGIQGDAQGGRPVLGICLEGSWGWIQGSGLVRAGPQPWKGTPSRREARATPGPYGVESDDATAGQSAGGPPA